MRKEIDSIKTNGKLIAIFTGREFCKMGRLKGGV